MDQFLKWFAKNLPRITAPVSKFSHWLQDIFGGSGKNTDIAGDGTPFGNVEHFFVLMLENRSFDHMLGFSGVSKNYGLTGKESCAVDPLNPTSEKIVVTPTSEVITHPDPGHEFDNVRIQLTGSVTGDYSKDSSIRNNGFIASYAASPTHKPADPTDVVKCMSAEKLPILTTLARQYAVCERWFSSLPGPTWPNRFFLHAASSSGLDDSPTAGESIDSLAIDGYEFPLGTIYSKLELKGLKWRVYHGDDLPQVAAIHGMNLKLLGNDEFRGYEFLSDDLNNKKIAYEPSFTFIEPNYGNSLVSDTEVDFEDGNSQHPVDNVVHGEMLIKDVYEKIFNSPVGKKSCLVIMYDEHGGFYDHMAPPTTTPPGGPVKYSKKGFDFTRLGVRVPVVIVSPYIAEGTVCSDIFDHSSVAATLRKRFGTAVLTDRDGKANTFEKVFSLTKPRNAITLPDPFHDAKAPEIKAAVPPLTENHPITPHTSAFLHLACQIDSAMNPNTKTATIERARAIRTQVEAGKFISRVQRQVKATKAKNPGSKATTGKPDQLPVKKPEPSLV